MMGETPPRRSHIPLLPSDRPHVLTQPTVRAGALGFLVQSHFSPMYDMDSAPVIRHLDKVLQTESGQLGSSCLLLAIFFSEIRRASVGFVEPEVGSS